MSPLRRLAAIVAALAALILAGALAGCGATDNSQGGPAGDACDLTAATCSAQTGQTSAGSSPSASCPSGAPTSPDDFHRQVTLQDAGGGLLEGDITTGTGPAIATGQTANVQYTGWLQNGCVFDTSRQSGRQPFSFPLGQGQVIKGWDQGVVGMKVGGIRRLVIPPSLGYGATGSPPVIPPNATLTFDIQLVSVS